MLDRNLQWMLAILLPLVLSATSLAAPLKPRIVVLTDIAPTHIEPDDMESIIRLFVHADLFEIEGRMTEPLTLPAIAELCLSRLVRPRRIES